MSGLVSRLKTEINRERLRGGYNACDFLTEILARIIDDKAHIKSLEKENDTLQITIEGYRVMVKELGGVEKKYKFLLDYYGKSCSVQMNGEGLWALRGFSGSGKSLDEAINNVRKALKHLKGGE